MAGTGICKLYCDREDCDYAKNESCTAAFQSAKLHVSLRSPGSWPSGQSNGSLLSIPNKLKTSYCRVINC